MIINKNDSLLINQHINDCMKTLAKWRARLVNDMDAQDYN